MLFKSTIEQFQKNGVLIRFTGHILALLIFLCFIPMILRSGELSYYLYWLVLAPLVAIQIAGARAGIFWTIALMGAHTLLFLHGANSQPEPMHTSFILNTGLLFLVAPGLLIVFKHIQTKRTAEANHQKSAILKEYVELKKEMDSLQESQKSLVAQNEDLKQIASMVSHDLRQPLRTINSFSQLLKRDLEKRESLAESSREFLNFITASARNMDSLIEEIIDNRKKEKEEKEAGVEFTEIQSIVQNNLQIQIRENDARLYWQNMPRKVAVSKMKLVQILQNLISNAIRYHRKNVMPVIIITCHATRRGWEFSVRDNGQGIAKKEQRRIFDAFVQLAETNDKQNSGIGLSTCKKIIEQLNGRIWLESEEGRGSVFFFEIPYSENDVSDIEQNNLHTKPQTVSDTI